MRLLDEGKEPRQFLATSAHTPRPALYPKLTLIELL